MQTPQNSLLATILQASILFYRNYLSMNMIGCCRFLPTCSEYALQAINRHGGLRALGIIMHRLGRCHPGFHGGHDPVQ